MKPARMAGAARAANQQLAVRGENKRPQGAAQPPDREQFLLGGHIPQFEGAVIAIARQRLAVRGKGYREKSLLMPGAGADEFASLHFP